MMLLDTLCGYANTQSKTLRQQWSNSATRSFCLLHGSQTLFHIRLLCLAADAGYINTDYIKFKIKQNTQIELRVNKIITKIFRNIRRKTVQSI